MTDSFLAMAYYAILTIGAMALVPFILIALLVVAGVILLLVRLIARVF